QHQRELVLPGMVVWLHQGPRRDLDLEHGQAPAGIGAFDLVVEPHAKKLDGLAFPRCHQLGARARGGGHYGPPWSGWSGLASMVCLSLTIHLRRLGAFVLAAVDGQRGLGNEEGPVGAAPHDGVGARTGRQQPSVPSTCREERARAVNSGQPWHLPYRLWADHSAWTSTIFAGRQCFLSALGPHGIRNRWSSVGTSGRARRVVIPGHRPVHRYDLGRRTSLTLGSNPTSPDA